MTILMTSVMNVSAYNYNGEQSYMLWVDIDDTHPDMKKINSAWMTYSQKILNRHWVDSMKTDNAFSKLRDTIYTVYQKTNSMEKKAKLTYLFQLVDKWDKAQIERKEQEQQKKDDKLRDEIFGINNSDDVNTNVSMNGGEWKPLPFQCETVSFFEEDSMSNMNYWMWDAWMAYDENGGGDIIAYKRYSIENWVLTTPYNEFTGEGWDKLSSSNTNYSMLNKIIDNEAYTYLTIYEINGYKVVQAEWNYALNHLYIDGVLYDDYSYYGVDSLDLDIIKQIKWNIFEIINWNKLIIHIKEQDVRNDDMTMKWVNKEQISCEIK